MKIIFFGTPEYVVPILEALHKTYNRGLERELIAVVTQPPQPVGREKKLEYSEVDHFAHKHNIPIFFDFEDLPEADLGVCAAYGRIIPEQTLARFSQGILNIHPSLLPLWRGTAPTQATIMSGAEQTGVTIIKTDEQMDHGPIVSSLKSDVLTTDTGETLRARLFQETVPFLLDLLPMYLKGKIQLKEQNHEKATYTKLLKKDHGYIPAKYIQNAIEGKHTTEEWAISFMKDVTVEPSAQTLDRFIRAITPWPGAYTTVRIKEEQKRMKILKAHCEENTLVIEEVQIEGKNPVVWKQFVMGYPDFTWA